MRNKTDKTAKWLWCVGHIERTAVIGWKSRAVLNAGATYFYPVISQPRAGDDPWTWVVVLDEAEWEAMPIEWIPRLKRLIQPGGGSVDAAALPCCAMGRKAMPLLKAAALDCFSGMSDTQIVVLMGYLKIALTKVSFFEDLKKLITHPNVLPGPV